MKEITLKIDENLYNEFLQLIKYNEARYDVSQMENIGVDDDYLHDIIIELIEQYVNSAPLSFYNEVTK